MAISFISPQEIYKKFQENIPDSVILATNNLIEKSYINNPENIHFTLQELVNEIGSILEIKPNHNGDVLISNLPFSNSYLDIENIKNEYWNIVYHKESYYSQKASYWTVTQK